MLGGFAKRLQVANAENRWYKRVTRSLDDPGFAKMIANCPEFQKRGHLPGIEIAKKVANAKEKAPKPLSLSAKSLVETTGLEPVASCV